MSKKISLLFIALVFILGLAACGPKVDPDQAAFDEAYQALNVVYPGGDSEKVIASFTLPTALRGGVTATWVSDDTTHAPIVTEGGVATVNVVRPENGDGNVEVTLTATVTLNNVTDTKEFTFTILEEPYVTVITLSEIKASDLTIDPAGSGTTGDLDGENVRIYDVTVIAKDSDAYWISDGTTTLMVYDAPTNVQIGQKGDIIAEI
ncbi:MAG: immunoglobulin-like domain-containing protein, partial [Acholeplasmataceae bacterium]